MSVDIDYFDSLPYDIVLSILYKLSSSANCPADFISVLITCKRLNGFGLNPLVLSSASQKMLAVKASNWSESAHRFLKLCVDTGNVEACYIYSGNGECKIFYKWPLKTAAENCCR